MSLLDGIAAFSDLSPSERTRLEGSGTVSEPRDGTEVFGKGDPANSIYAIVGGDGHVRVGAIDRRSKSLMVEVFRFGEIFGEIGVIDQGLRSAAAVVEGRVKLMRIPATTFLDAISNNPALGQALCRLLAQRLRRTFDLFQDASFETLEVRLARQVLYLADREGRQVDNGIRLTHRLRQGDLADLLGATTRSIITILNAWRAENIVLYDTERALLTLCEPDALQALIRQNAN